MNSLKKVSLALIFTLGLTYTANAQELDTRNHVEYDCGSGGADDVNSIKVPEKVKRKKKVKKEISVEDLQEVKNQTENVRYRKKRQAPKCKKEVKKKEDCENKNVTKLLNKRKKKK